MMLMSKETNPQQNGAVQQRINEMVQQSRILEAYMNDILVKEATVSKLIGEAHLTSQALQDLGSDSEYDSLIPLGIGVYAKARILPINDLYVNVGADVTLGKSRQDTINFVESKIKEFEIAGRQLYSQKEQIASRMHGIQNEINGILQKSS